MLVFIGKLSLSTLRWIPMYQGSNHFSVFFASFCLAKLATSSRRVKIRSFRGWVFTTLLAMPYMHVMIVGFLSDVEEPVMISHTSKPCLLTAPWPPGDAQTDRHPDRPPPPARGWYRWGNMGSWQGILLTALGMLVTQGNTLLSFSPDHPHLDQAGHRLDHYLNFS